MERSSRVPVRVAGGLPRESSLRMRQSPRSLTSHGVGKQRVGEWQGAWQRQRVRPSPSGRTGTALGDRLPPAEPRGRAGGARQHPAGQRRPARDRPDPQRRRLLSRRPPDRSTGRSATSTTWARRSTPITLADELIRRDQFEQIGGDETLAEIVDSVPHAANGKYYAEIVREKSISRAADRERQRDHPRRLFQSTSPRQQLLEVGRAQGLHHRRGPDPRARRSS